MIQVWFQIKNVARQYNRKERNEMYLWVGERSEPRREQGGEKEVDGVNIQIGNSKFPVHKD